MNMENTMKMYITADEVAELLGVSRGYAYKVIRVLNDELKAKGFRVISGKVPRKYFQEKFYGMVV
jgi:sugar-specific transcriptional regulator TrmB